jgi:hypothetical protein
MTNFEQPLSQEIIDQQAANALLPQAELYLQGAQTPEKQAVYQAAGRFVSELYDEFTPDISKEAREVGTVLGAAGLALVEERFGHDEYSPKLYGGSHESRVLATYHHAGHSRMFIRNMFAYATKVNELEPGTYGPEAFARFPGIGALHDSVMGNGRGNDERQSALLAGGLMRRVVGMSGEDPETVAGVDATTWNDTLKAQSVEDGQPYLPYRRVAAVADLLSLFTEASPYLSVCVAVEDLCKQQKGQLLTREADAAGFSLEGASIEDCLQFIDTSPALRAAYGEMLGGQAAFGANFKPADPRLDTFFPARAANAVFKQEMAERYAAGDMSALQTLQASRDYMRTA